MTILYGATQGVNAIKAEALAIHQAKTQKFHLRNGTLWLHWSGLMLTSDSKQAWSGTIEQARACRRKFDAAAGCKTDPVDLTPLPTTEEAI